MDLTWRTASAAGAIIRAFFGKCDKCGAEITGNLNGHVPSRAVTCGCGEKYTVPSPTITTRDEVLAFLGAPNASAVELGPPAPPGSPDSRIAFGTPRGESQVAYYGGRSILISPEVYAALLHAGAKHRGLAN